MPSAPASAPRPELERTSTWPPSIRIKHDSSTVHKAGAESAGSMSFATVPSKGELIAPDDHKHYLSEDLEDHPEDLMYEYDEWFEDSDDDGEEVEWDAGITDFALFDSDRRRAQEEHDSLPSKWHGFMSSQQSALRRAEQRSRAHSLPDTTRPPLPFEEVPGLTPDHSPNLRDDLDAVDSYHGQSAPRPVVPSYLTVTVTPPEDDEDDDDDKASVESDEDLPLSFYVQRAGQRRQERRQMQRPGLQYRRTLSGKEHVWRRPSWYLYSVGEDVDAERSAELGVGKGGVGDAEGREGGR